MGDRSRSLLQEGFRARNIASFVQYYLALKYFKFILLLHITRLNLDLFAVFVGGVKTANNT
jgi:hypothetical protein